MEVNTPGDDDTEKLKSLLIVEPEDIDLMMEKLTEEDKKPFEKTSGLNNQLMIKNDSVFNC